MTVALSVKVPRLLADQVREVASSCHQSTSSLLREYVEATAAGRRLQLVDGEDELRGYLVLLDDAVGGGRFVKIAQQDIAHLSDAEVRLMVLAIAETTEDAARAELEPEHGRGRDSVVTHLGPPRSMA